MAIFDKLRGASGPASPLPAPGEAPVRPPRGDAGAAAPATNPEGRVSAIPPVVTDFAGWALRLLVLGVFVVALFTVLSYFSAVSVPVAIAFLIAALLTPAVGLLRKAHFSQLWASVTALIGMVIVVVGVMYAVGAQAVAEAPELIDQTSVGLQSVMNWLGSGPLGISATDINGYIQQLQDWLQSQGARLAAGAAAVGTSIGSFLAGMVTALLVAFFFVYSGDKLWTAAAEWIIPARARDRVNQAARRGWSSLVSYMRATVIVCLVDATGIALVATALGVPMPVALFALTFIASFVPIVGAFLAGTVAVVLALVTHGWVSALIMLGGVLMVNFVEGNVLQPFLLGKAVSLHPIATVLGLTAGATISGILGALVSIPLMAFLAALARALRDPEAVPADSELPNPSDVAGRSPDSGDVRASGSADDTGADSSGARVAPRGASS